jgi:uncharacterized protein (DUF1330 family)
MKAAAVIAFTVGGLMLGAVGGAVAVQSQHQNKAYLIGEITISDQQAYTTNFLPAAKATIQQAGGTYLVAGGLTDTLEGQPPPNRVVVIQFDNMEKLQAYWNSAANKQNMTIGRASASFRLFGAEGIDQNQNAN